MLDLSYSIIPTPGSSMVCSSCGEKIEDLPEYTNLSQLFLCINRKGNKFFYIGIGIAVPMCAYCKPQVTEKIESVNKKYGCLICILALAGMAMVGASRDDGFNPAVLVLGIIAICIAFGLKQGRTSRQIDKAREFGFDLVSQVYDEMVDKGWNPEIGKSRKTVDYGHDLLQQDLEKICRNGNFCILNNITGYIEDINDLATVGKIYDQSIYFCTDDD